MKILKLSIKLIFSILITNNIFFTKSADIDMSTTQTILIKLNQLIVKLSGISTLSPQSVTILTDGISDTDLRIRALDKLLIENTPKPGQFTDLEFAAEIKKLEQLHTDVKNDFVTTVLPKTVDDTETKATQKRFNKTRTSMVSAGKEPEVMAGETRANSSTLLDKIFYTTDDALTVKLEQQCKHVNENATLAQLNRYKLKIAELNAQLENIVKSGSAQLTSYLNAFAFWRNLLVLATGKPLPTKYCR